MILYGEQFPADGYSYIQNNAAMRYLREEFEKVILPLFRH